MLKYTYRKSQLNSRHYNVCYNEVALNTQNTILLTESKNRENKDL
jgi:hypothetical protein